MRLSSGKSSDPGADGTRRRSERLGKQASPNVFPAPSKPITSPNASPAPSKPIASPNASPAPSKPIKIEQPSPGPLRRSCRFQTQGSAENASSPTDAQKKKGQKEKSVDLTPESTEVSADSSTKRKGMNARSYKALFKKQKKSKGSDGKFEKHNQVDSQQEDCENVIELPLEGSLASCSKEISVQKVESGEQVRQPESESSALHLEVDSSRIVANKESSTLVVEAVSSGSASTKDENSKAKVDAESAKEISIVHGLKTNSSKFVEYWVPVPVSNVQLEHYCATLLANDITLCSPVKKDNFGVLPNIIRTVQKCCDHPYLVDQSFYNSVMKNFTPHDNLNVGIKASGKVQLLDMILTKCRRPKLKVLILYQSYPGPVGIGDVLDDFMRQKFGENSYGRLESSLIPSKRQETLNKFNDKGSEQFVLLLEHQACSSSVKLLLVDFVISFNTEFSRPANVVRDLQRISIAQSNQIKLFRLYSSHTLEEKVLVLAKHQKYVNILQNTNRTMSDSLLMWGASVLFNRLDKFHAEQGTTLSLDCLAGQQFLLDDIVKNFMIKIINEPEDEHDSIISRAFFNQGAYYMDKLLLGEREVPQTDGEERQLFWKKLLEGRKPWWRFLGPTSRSRKRAIHDENSETATKYQKVVGTRDAASNSHPDSEMESGGQKAVTKADSDQPKPENEQTILHEFLKGEMEKLFSVLQLAMDIKQMVGAFMEYVIKNHQVSKEPVSIFHALQISLCWTAAKILKKKMDKEETVMRAKNALNFQCTIEQTHSVYDRLRTMKKTFQQLQTKNSVSVPSQKGSAPQTLYEGRPLSAALDIQNGKIENEEGSCSLELLEALTPDKLNGCCQDKKIKLLLEQHEKERLDFHKAKEEEKSQLVNDHRIESAFIRKTYHEDGTARSMLMNLENELRKNIEEHENLTKVQFEELQTWHSAEKKKMVDEWRAKEMSRIASSKTEKEVPSVSHNTKKLSPGNVVQDNGTLIASGVSLTIADNAVYSDVCVPDEPLKIERADAEPAIVIEQPEITSHRSPQIQTIIALEAGGSGASFDTSLCIPVNSVQGELEVKAGGAEPGGSKSSPCTPEGEVLGVERAGSVSVTVIHPEVFTQTPPDKSENEHARVEPVKGVERSKEPSSQNNGPSSAIGGPEVGDACIPERENSTGHGGGNTTGSHGMSHHNEPFIVRGPSGSESCHACCPEAETGDNTMGSDTAGHHCIPAPQPSTEVIISLPVLIKTGNQASDCNTLSVDAVNHVHIERSNSLSAPAVSVQMAEGSVELSNQAVTQHEGTLGLTSAKEMDTGNLCSQFKGIIASPATSQVVEQSVEHSCQDAIVQPPSRADSTHRDNQFDLETLSGANGGPSIELPSASQNIPYQFLAQSQPNLAVADGPTYVHVNPMHHIGSRNSTLASHSQSLESELYTLRKDREQIVKLFESKKSFLKSEYERELEEIRMKYEEKRKEAESAFMPKITQADLNFKVASMHKTLSEALQFKCSDGRTPGNSTVKQGSASPRFIQQMHQVQARLIHPSAATLPSTSHPTSVQQNASSQVQNHRASTGRPAMSLHNITGSHHRSSGPASVRPPQISSITPSVGSPRVGGEIRAPAPHLQPYRPPAPRLPSNILIPNPNQPSLSSPSVPAHQGSLRPNPPSQSPSGLHHSTSLNQDVASSQQNGASRGLLNLSFSAVEQLMANGDVPGSHMPNTLRNLAGSSSNANANASSTNRVSGDVNGGIPTSDDVHFLSDDDS